MWRESARGGCSQSRGLRRLKRGPAFTRSARGFCRALGFKVQFEQRPGFTFFALARHHAKQFFHIRLQAWHALGEDGDGGQPYLAFCPATQCLLVVLPPGKRGGVEFQRLGKILGRHADHLAHEAHLTAG